MKPEEDAIRALKAIHRVPQRLRERGPFWRTWNYWHWRYSTQRWLERLYGETSPQALAFAAIEWPDRPGSGPATESEYQKRCFDTLAEGELLLGRFIREYEGANSSREA